MRLDIEGFFERYAALLIEGDLPDDLKEIDGMPDEFISVQIEPGERKPGEFQTGWITITAVNLEHRFEAAQLRKCIQECVDANAEAGDKLARAQAARAKHFLDALAAEPGQQQAA